MSNIDTNIANRVVTLEHLNLLPHTEPYTFDSDPDFEYPSAPNPKIFKAAIYNHPVPAQWEEILKVRFGDFRRTYPHIRPDGEEVTLWRKYYVKQRCTVGSIYSKNDQITNRRDDTHIWWLEGGKRQYGQVTIFAEVYDYEPIALIRRFKNVKENKVMETTIVGDTMGALELILVQDIGGLIGRIEKNIEVKEGIGKRGTNNTKRGITTLIYLVCSGRENLYT